MRSVRETKADGSTQYLARPIIDGKKLAVRAATRRELLQKVAKLKDQADRRRRGLPIEEALGPNIAYGALCDLLLDGYTHREQSQKTLGYNLRYSRDRFEKVPLRTIRYEHARAWFASLTVASTTKRNALTAARQAFNFAMETGYAADNPFRKIEKPRATESKQPFESWQEVIDVSANLVRREEQALILFACATGLRPQEWQALQWRDIDHQSGVLRVNRTVQAGRVIEANAKTPGALRAVELFDLALEALESLPTPLKRDKLVFPGKRGGILDTHAWSRRGKRPGPWTTALARAGLNHRGPGQMRHTFATLALADGAGIEWISKQLGHESIATTTRHYQKWLPTDRRNVNVLNSRHRERTGLKADSARQEARQT
jgi:integrase